MFGKKKNGNLDEGWENISDVEQNLVKQQAQASQSRENKEDKNDIASVVREGTVPNTPLPPGWSWKLDSRGRIYFLNHLRKITEWNDPRPLPAEWGQKIDTKRNRPYFLNHNTQQTTWKDPRPFPPLPRPGEKSGSGGVSQGLEASMVQLLDISDEKKEGTPSEALPAGWEKKISCGTK